MDVEQDKLYKSLAFYRSALATYIRFKGGASGDIAGDDAEVTSEVFESTEAAEAEGRTFALERDLQAALRSNVAQLEPGLQIADGGRETRVEAGLIDILAKDGDDSWVVIELKAEVARPTVIAQTLAYMASLQSERGGNARWIIVASDFDRRVELAAKAVPTLSLKRYKFRFEFE